MRLFILVIILVSLGVGLGTLMPREILIRAIVLRDFFDAAIPVLGFGALIKYLCTNK